MGKVHGSLARAGKVRNQTPKVAKAEEKGKSKTGRAKKRFLFNQRFASAKGGVKKQKPNSQIVQAEKRKFKEDQAERIKLSKEAKKK
jgi:small subunit ribosomal protein S30e